MNKKRWKFFISADIGDLVVLMAKRRYLQHEDSDDGNSSSAMNSRRVVTFNQKMVCHVFESDEVCEQKPTR